VLPKEDRDRAGNIFNTLDTSGDGTLGADDFDHPFASVKKTLGEVWMFLIEQFDFNHDGVIEPHEFLGHFIMYALYFMPAEPSNFGNLGDQLLHWEHMFLRNFRHRVTEIETLVSSGR